MKTRGETVEQSFKNSENRERLLKTHEGDEEEEDDCCSALG